MAGVEFEGFEGLGSIKLTGLLTDVCAADVGAATDGTEKLNGEVDGGGAVVRLNVNAGGLAAVV